jgi:N utilization substance protein B
MGARTGARESALQMLYAIEVTRSRPAEVMGDFWREHPGDPEGRPYADELMRGVTADTEPLDALIRTASTNWRLERMARVDRNVLRLGTWELVHQFEIPRAVILDEYVELAKRYGSEDSGGFVNGVLDRIADDLGRTDVPDAGSNEGT